MIRFLVLDVDGTLTDGGIYYGDDGNEYKRFCVQDGTGIISVIKRGIGVALITARESDIVKRRAKDLGIEHVYQNIWDKEKKLISLIEELCLNPTEIAYVGDDTIDIPAMKLCGFIACPSNSCDAVKEISHYIATAKGGHGAVREIIEYIIKNLDSCHNMK